MALDKPTKAGLWWFKGKFGKKPHQHPHEGPVEYDGGDSYPIQIMACDDIFKLEDFDGEFWPLDHDVVIKGNTEWTYLQLRLQHKLKMRRLKSSFRKCGPKPA